MILGLDLFFFLLFLLFYFFVLCRLIQLMNIDILTCGDCLVDYVDQLIDSVKFQTIGFRDLVHLPNVF